MQLNKWTIALAATGAVSFGAFADEHPVATALSSTTLSGYVDTAAIWNFGRGAAVANRGINTAANRQDGFNLNGVKVALEKALDEGTWSAGYKVETIFGPNALELPGLLGGSQIALKQAYVALRAPVGNGIDFKVGHYDPIVGYEVVDGYANPNFSRSFGYNIEPFGHTGVLASYQFNEVFGASAGVANSGSLNGSALTANFGGTGLQTESVKTYMLGVVAKAPESTGWFAGSSLYAGVVDGGGGIRAGGDNILVYVGGTMATPWKELTLGASYDTLLVKNGSYANAFALYVSYQVTEKLKVNNRFEYANSGFGNFVSPAFGTVSGLDEKVLAYTGTIDYALWANVVSRLEFRWDHVAGGVGTFGGQKNDLSVAANLIYKF